jgi:hypothetical protein
MIEHQRRFAVWLCVAIHTGCARSLFGSVQQNELSDKANSLARHDGARERNDFNWLAFFSARAVQCLSDNRTQMFVHAVLKYGILKYGILKVGKLVAKT